MPASRSLLTGRAAALATLTTTLALTHAGSALAAPDRVLLRTAGSFAVLGGSGLTNTGVSTIDGDVGSSPTSSQTGFAPCPAADCVALTGTNHDDPNPNDAVTQQAKTDLTTAYDDAFSRTGGTPITAPLGGGQTLVAGVYSSAADVFVGGDLTLDGGGDPDAVWIFQARTGTLKTAAGTAAGIPNTRVLLANGAQACNVFWQVGSSATIETSTQFVGNILALQSITVGSGATIETGSALARNAAVTLDANVIRRATCAPPVTPPAPGPTPTPTPDPTPTPQPEPSAGTSPSGPSSGTSPSEPSGGTSPGDAPTASSFFTPIAASSLVAPARGAARLSGPRGPVRGPFTVTVTGRSIARVTFLVDGRRVRSVAAIPGRTRFSVRIEPRQQSRRVHRVTARVTFKPSSRTPPTAPRLAYQRPPATPGTPRFTG